jgi:hypothetical protein
MIQLRARGASDRRRRFQYEEMVAELAGRWMESKHIAWRQVRHSLGSEPGQSRPCLALSDQAW